MSGAAPSAGSAAREGEGGGAVPADELGAHVSVAGGVDRAPERARDIRTRNLQLFTKQPSRWAEPELEEGTVERFRGEREARGIEVAVAHDSYLINLASPTTDLWERSLGCFIGELRRSTRLGLDFVVTHPGNATDGRQEDGIARNADALVRALEQVEGETRLLLELTAGSGSTVGGSFENLAAILARVPRELRNRTGICVDTCHAFSAGYDLVDDYEGVWEHFADVFERPAPDLFHLNDSKHPLGSRKDRHEHIGEGTLGPEPFRRLMTDERFGRVPKLLETPKGKDMVTLDLQNLARLRAFRDEAS